ncbi:ATP-binding protein [Consotaella salsifontis]|uniref:AAA domain-containing protein n=1 Tax=Consotaella salsifontis TaxID=1365950 RepID=A0A1T4NFQ5_9HYPH|nr:ATP-binding protein [Consotaella salsifontis]SJZ78201.1 AAA domain-containing protein [Consotaella salsifontis]
MITPGLRIRHLAFHGPNREAAAVEFGAGLNLLYGASDTGKSFVVEAIDFMLGGKTALRDIPERIGYDLVLLGIETMDSEQFTLSRSADGGNFRLFRGLYLEPPPADSEARELADQHSERSADNLSSFLLEKCGLNAKRVRRNKRGDTNSLSFRNLARLMIVTETEITSQRSPLTDGNPTADTPNFATFKLLLTGVDDSALVAQRAATPEDQTREAQIELLDQLIGEYRDRIKGLAKQPKELEDQLGRLEGSLDAYTQQLTTSEADFRRLSGRRRELRERLEQGKDRRAEITSLLERFDLLGEHYRSDVDRLRGIEEAGTLFSVLGHTQCPLCGAPPEHHQRDAECGGNVEAVVAAARSEIAKIELLQRELDDTVAALRREGAGFDRRLPKVEGELSSVSSELEGLTAPKLRQLRASYGELADKRGEVREALAIYRTLQDMEKRREDLERGSDQRAAAVSDGDLPTTVATNFAQRVETILKGWHFPGADRVYFDAKARDLVIGGKLRTARGKGLRAITHAAFTIGLLEYCRENNTPHPGFVVLDSPLLAYREPEGDDLDLIGTDLNAQFYSYLAKLPVDRQVIVIENRDPPSEVSARPNVLMFSKNPNSGRYGFFPLAAGVVGTAAE